MDPKPALARAAGIALLLALTVSDVSAEVLRSRVVTPNGRTVQEIRFGNEPGSDRLMRVVVVTNGPSAGTTTLATAVADVNDWVESAAPAPVFTAVIASGTAFSVGGGCRRGNQTDFPFIDANRPRILRVVNGTPTVITPAIPGIELFDSADCTVSGDGTRTFFIFTNRSVQRLWFFSDAGGPLDLNNPLVTFSAVRTPLEGGLRPAISIVPGTARTVAFLFMATNGQSRWFQYDVDDLNVDFNCLAGVQSPAPTGFTIPRGAKVSNREAIGDFNGDGTFEVVRIDTSSASLLGGCASQPAATGAGPVAGTGFNWREPGVAVDPQTGQINFLAGTYSFIQADGTLVQAPGENTVGGSSAACVASNTETLNRFVSAGAASSAISIELQDFFSRQPSKGDTFMTSGVEVDRNFAKLFCTLLLTGGGIN